MGRTKVEMPYPFKQRFGLQTKYVSSSTGKLKNCVGVSRPLSQIFCLEEFLSALSPPGDCFLLTLHQIVISLAGVNILVHISEWQHSYV